MVRFCEALAYLHMAAAGTDWLELQTCNCTSRALTSNLSTRTVNTPVTSSPGQHSDRFSFHLLDNLCSEPQGAMSTTSIGLSSGIMIGQHRITRAVFYRPQGSPASRHVNVFSTGGSDCITRHGYHIFGLPPSQMQSMLNWSPWTNLYGFLGGKQTGTSLMAADVTNLFRSGTPPQAPGTFQRKACIGKTGRRWRPKPAPRHRRRQPRIRSRTGHRNTARIGPWLLMMVEILLCPTPHCVLRAVLSRSLLHLRLQVYCVIWVACAAQAQQGSSTAGAAADMSDSSVEEAPPPNRPAGPPTPLPVQAQQELAHQISNAVARELTFQGTILTYLPWDIRHLRSIVVSIRAMRPHEWAHPNVLTVHDSAQAEAEEAEEEPPEEDGHVEHGHGHGHGNVHDNEHMENRAAAEETLTDDLGHGTHTEGRSSRRQRILARLRATGRPLMTSTEVSTLNEELGLHSARTALLGTETSTGTSGTSAPHLGRHSVREREIAA